MVVYIHSPIQYKKEKDNNPVMKDMYKELANTIREFLNINNFILIRELSGIEKEYFKDTNFIVHIFDLEINEDNKFKIYSTNYDKERNKIYFEREKY